MADQAVVDAVTTRLQTYLATNPIPRTDGTPWPVLLPDQEATPPADGGEYISLQFPIGSEDMITAGGSVGNRLVREEGVIRLVASEPRGNGQALSLSMINNLREQFRFKEFAGIRTFGASPAVNNDSNSNGAWWSLSTVIRYWFDFTA